MFASLYPETEIAETDVLPPSLSARRLAEDVVFPSSTAAFAGWLDHGRPPLPDLLCAPGLRRPQDQPHLRCGRRQPRGRVKAALPQLRYQLILHDCQDCWSKDKLCFERRAGLRPRPVLDHSSELLPNGRSGREGPWQSRWRWRWGTCDLGWTKPNQHRFRGRIWRRSRG